MCKSLPAPSEAPYPKSKVPIKQVYPILSEALGGSRYFFVLDIIQTMLRVRTQLTEKRHYSRDQDLRDSTEVL